MGSAEITAEDMKGGKRILGALWSLETGCLAFVLTAYVGVVLGVMIWSNGLPYVFDGNETFSSLIHARNWIEFGTGVTYGLADESYGLSPSSHPFIHTHQGNMPRLAATLLYGIGIRSPESQIWVHALLIGPIIVMAAYAFALRLGGRWLATGICLALIFSYVFFIQWQLNTYRIWGMFFMAVGLMLAEYVDRRNLRYFSVLLFVFCALLFYGELVYAVFCGTLLGVYIVLRHFRQWRIVVLCGLSMIAGAVTAISVLVVQLIAFYGGDNLIKDFTYTFLTRNLSADVYAIPEEVTDFFSKIPVVFLHNAQDQSVLRTFDRFIESLFTFQASVYHPLIFVFTLPPIMFWVAQGLLSDTGIGHYFRRIKVSGETSYVLWMISVFYLAFEIVLNRSLESYVFVPSIETNGGIRAIIFAVVCAFALIYTRRQSMALLRSQEGAHHRLLVSAGFGAIVALCIGWIDGLFSGELAGFWQIEAGMFPRMGVGLIEFVTVWAMMIALLFPQARALFPKIQQAPLAILAMASILAYSAVFLVSAGYLFSGYLYRGQSPLVIQWAVFFGLGFAILAHMIWVALGRQRTIRITARDTRVLKALSGAHRDIVSAASVGFILMISAWGLHQANYAVAIPPTQFAFTQKILIRPDIQGHTSVSNTYAAPFAYQMGNWSYADYRIGAGRIVWNGEEWEPGLRSLDYLWFADRHTNKDYLRPDFFICFMPTSLVEESRRLLGRKSPDCFDMPLVRQAVEGKDAGVELVAAADAAPRRWAILRFNWDMPPRGSAAGVTSRTDR